MLISKLNKIHLLHNYHAYIKVLSQLLLICELFSLTVCLGRWASKFYRVDNIFITNFFGIHLTFWILKEPEISSGTPWPGIWSHFQGQIQPKIFGRGQTAKKTSFLTIFFSKFEKNFIFKGNFVYLGGTRAPSKHPLDPPLAIFGSLTCMS